VAPADGHTFLYAHDGVMVMSPMLYLNLPYDPAMGTIPGYTTASRSGLHTWVGTSTAVIPRISANQGAFSEMRA
jgi:hypothetical protein